MFIQRNGRAGHGFRLTRHSVNRSAWNGPSGRSRCWVTSIKLELGLRSSDQGSPSTDFPTGSDLVRRIWRKKWQDFMAMIIFRPHCRPESQQQAASCHSSCAVEEVLPVIRCGTLRCFSQAMVLLLRKSEGV